MITSKQHILLIGSQSVTLTDKITRNSVTSNVLGTEIDGSNKTIWLDSLLSKESIEGRDFGLTWRISGAVSSIVEIFGAADMLDTIST